MAPDKRTRNTTKMSATPPPGSRAHRDWDRNLTDAMIYALAIGGFYVGYQTLHTLALAVGFPADQAHVVAALADLAILAYSRKAVQEVNAGRSAWGIRLIVAAFSLGTFALQLKAAWPHPVSVGFHALPPAVWIIGHEMMLRGKLRRAKEARRDREIAQGLRPAKLQSIRPVQWLLAPRRTFQVWKLMQLWEVPRDLVVRELADRWTAENPDEKVPAAWRAPLVTTTTFTLPPTPVSPFKLPADDPGSDRQHHDFAIRARVLTLQGDPADPQIVTRFLNELPVITPKGQRTEQDYVDFIRHAERIAEVLGIACTGKIIAEVLDVDASRISRISQKMRKQESAI